MMAATVDHHHQYHHAPPSQKNTQRSNNNVNSNNEYNVVVDEQDVGSEEEDEDDDNIICVHNDYVKLHFTTTTTTTITRTTCNRNNNSCMKNNKKSAMTTTTMKTTTTVTTAAEKRTDATPIATHLLIKNIVAFYVPHYEHVFKDVFIEKELSLEQLVLLDNDEKHHYHNVQDDQPQQPPKESPCWFAFFHKGDNHTEAITLAGNSCHQQHQRPVGALFLSGGSEVYEYHHIRMANIPVFVLRNEDMMKIENMMEHGHTSTKVRVEFCNDATQPPPTVPWTRTAAHSKQRTEYKRTFCLQHPLEGDQHRHQNASNVANDDTERGSSSDMLLLTHSSSSPPASHISKFDGKMEDVQQGKAANTNRSTSAGSEKNPRHIHHDDAPNAMGSRGQDRDTTQAQQPLSPPPAPPLSDANLDSHIDSGPSTASSSSSSSREVTAGEFKKKRKSFFKKATMVFDRRAKSLHKWKDDMRHYVSTMEILDKANCDDLEMMAQRTLHFIDKKRHLVEIWHLVFGATLVEVLLPMKRSIYLRQLQHDVLVCLVGMQDSGIRKIRWSQLPGSEVDIPEQWRPRPVFRRFIGHAFEGVASGVGAIDKREDRMWLLLAWVECGALDREFVTEANWKKVRASLDFVDEPFAPSVFYGFLPLESSVTLCLLCCDTLNDCLCILRSAYDEWRGRLLPLDPSGADRLAVFLRVELDNSLDERRQQGAEKLLQCLGCLDNASKDAVVEDLVDHVPDGRYSRLCDAICSFADGSHHVCSLFGRFLSKQWSRWGPSLSLTMEEVVLLPVSSIGKVVLSSREGLATFMTWAREICRSDSYRFTEKLLFIERLARNSVFEDDSMADLLEAAARSFRLCKDLLLCHTLQMAREKHHMFDNRDVGFLNRATDMFLTNEDGRRLFRNPAVLHGTLGSPPSGETGRFYKWLIERCVDLLIQECATLEDAVNFSMGILGLPASLAVKIACSVFLNALEHWQPDTLFVIVFPGVSVLRGILQCFSEFRTRALVEHAQEMSRIDDFARKVGDVVIEWGQRYTSRKISLEDVKMATSITDETWALLSVFSGVSLPSAEEVLITRRKSNAELVIIYKHLSGPEDCALSLREILAGYNCEEEALESLICAYGDKDSETASGRTLADISEDAIQAAKFRASHDSLLSICAYFLQNVSVLFRKSMLCKIKGKQTVDSLANAASATMGELNALFLPIASYERLVVAVQVLLRSKKLVDDELHVLQNYPGASWAGEGIQRFRTVAALFPFAGPLQAFVDFCRLSSFAVVEHAGFSHLSKITQNLLRGAVHSDDMLLELGSLLCGSTEAAANFNDTHSLLVKDYLPVLRFVQAVHSNSEVTILARDMKWLGRKGIARFQKEAENITNILPENTQSNETSILDSLLVAVPAVSFLDSCRGCKSVAGLLTALKLNHDVMALCRAETFDELSQVEQNCSLIRELFIDGIDEQSLFLQQFKAVSSNGFYAIDSPSAAKPAVSEGVTNELVLHYDVQRYGRRSSRTLSGRALAEFVVHVGLIEDESGTVTTSIDMFLEVHDMVSKAAVNYIAMEKMGYSTGTNEFRCPIDDAVTSRKLLLKSETEVDFFAVWLRELRRANPISLLFWTDELYQLHESLKAFEQAWTSSGDDDLERTLNEIRLLADRLDHDHVLTAYQARAHLSQAIWEGGWLAVASKFLELLSGSCENPNDLFRVDCRERGDLVLHTISCQPDEQNQVACFVLRHIYKDRLPRAFEVLDCVGGCTEEQLELFLLRGGAFPCFTFAILNIDVLEGTVLEKLMKFLSSKPTITTGRLHCMQRGPVIMHPAPWVESREWGTSAVQIEGKRDAGLATLWKELMCDRKHVDCIVVVWAPSPGTGKTRHIQEEMRGQDHGPFRKTGSIVLHEGSTISSLTVDLIAKYSSGKDPCAVHFSLTYMPDHTTDPSWLESVNHFFLSLLLLRCLHDPLSGSTFHLGNREWQLYVELAGDSSVPCPEWLQHYVPILFFSSTLCTPKKSFHVDDETRRVCTYLRALEDGTINRKFKPSTGPKAMIFVLDKSSSMGVQVCPEASALSVATDNALAIFDSHLQIGDSVGVVLFDKNVTIPVPAGPITSTEHKNELREKLDGVRRDLGCGTDIYWALCRTLGMIRLSCRRKMETWIVCLTDGASSRRSKDAACRSLVERSPDTHLIIIGVNLNPLCEVEMRELCGSKYSPFSQRETKGFYIASPPSLQGLRAAFAAVSNRIPVSRTFDFDGDLTDSDCERLIERYSPRFISPTDMLLKTFWVRFLYRRVKVLDDNKSFNYNETHDSLGSNLMKTMLDEVERLLDSDHNHDWVGSNHAQLIYDFSVPDAPEFRLVCTSPLRLSDELKHGYMDLNLPGFFVPTEEYLAKRSTLDNYLSQALGVTLEAKENGEKHLKCIDDHGFILTLDFTMKLLGIHERVACKLPCVMEGETGVSKTALTKMYSVLRNSALQQQARRSTLGDLSAVEVVLHEKGYLRGSGNASLGRLLDSLERAGESTIGNETDMSRELHSLLLDQCTRRSSLFKPVPSKHKEDVTTTAVRKFLLWFDSCDLEQTFFEINVDTSLQEKDFVGFFARIRATAKRLLSEPNAIVVVFLDEINTSSVMGLMKEIVVDRKLNGEVLEPNIVIVAACNPSRKAAATSGQSVREKDLGKEWASGHYQVSELPSSMGRLKWSFGALKPTQETEFVYRRLERMSEVTTVSTSLRREMTELVTVAHESMRQLAYKKILASLGRSSDGCMTREALEADCRQRSCSVVSLRDIQRVFDFFEFFTSGATANPHRLTNPTQTTALDSMLLAVAVVYYLRLDNASRADFMKNIRALSVRDSLDQRLQVVLGETMDRVIEQTSIPSGIAATRGLKENVFMTLVCCLSQTPLLIVGPPGSSKTLSVNMVANSSNGTDSSSGFYRGCARLSLFHYQCSRQSTSREIAAVFERAVRRQEKVNPKTHRCVVFMDEAGLPEEDRDSLKVLHYLLEGHMSAKAKVGFVAISNHVLDAAKSNRCVTLLRQQPDADEMMSITRGVLFDPDTQYVMFGDQGMHAVKFAANLCAAYSMLLSSDQGFDLAGFFGLRDYIHFLKAMRLRSMVKMLELRIPVSAVVFAVERNFNGIDHKVLSQVTLLFLESLKQGGLSRWLYTLRHPFDVVREALQADNECQQSAKRSRFKLIIDSTEDDSVIRLLGDACVIDLSKRSFFKLSHMPEEQELERLRLISGVKYTASLGKLAVLSQTGGINESFYDMFNQNFSSVRGRDGQTLLYANIAVGGISRRSRIDEHFSCIVHVRESQLGMIPAPFLNRFEKYNLDTRAILDAGLRGVGVAHLVKRARATVEEKILAEIECGLFGFVGRQTLDSVFIGMLPARALHGVEESRPPRLSLTRDEACGLLASLRAFFLKVTSLEVTDGDLDDSISAAIELLPAKSADSLQSLVSSDDSESIQLSNALESILTDESPPQSVLASALAFTVQVVIARKASQLLMQIATPEAVFRRRNNLPAEVVHKYFEQEHFNLRRLISRVEGSRNDARVRLSIVYTRSDASIYRIPRHVGTLAAKAIDPQQLNTIRSLIHAKAEEVFVEHLYLLRTEAALRSSIMSWIKSKERRIYVLLIHMAPPEAVDRVNFVRSFVEQNAAAGHRKSLYLVLHYPPSISIRSFRYPALFLGGWTHHFLDGIGQQDEYLGTAKVLERACVGDGARQGTDNVEVEACLAKALPRVLSHVATLAVLYDRQASAFETEPGAVKCGFIARQKFLTWVMSRRLGDRTVGGIVCRKFSEIWLEQGLVRALAQASEGLVNGTTHLSMTMSVQGTLLDSFDAFVSRTIVEMNRHRNLDVLTSSTSEEVLVLFGKILERLPVPPWEELLLHRWRAVTLNALPQSAQHRSVSGFPFFSFVSSCLSEVVELAHQTAMSSATLDEQAQSTCRFASAMYECATEILHDKDSTISSNWANRRAASLLVVQHMGSTGDELLDAYSQQLIRTKTGRLSVQWLVTTQDWLLAQLAEEGTAEDLLGVHILAHIHGSKLVDVASWSITCGQLFDGDRSEDTQSEGVQTVEQVLKSKHSLFLRFLAAFERGLMDTSMKEKEWSDSFELFLQHWGSFLVFGPALVDENIAHRLRVLRFLNGLIRNEVSSRVQLIAMGRLYEKRERRVSVSAAAHASLPELLRILEQDKTIAALNVLLDTFFSPPWTEVVPVFQEADMRCVLQSYSELMLSEKTEQLSGILKQAMVCPFMVDESLSSPVPGLPSSTLKLLAQKIAVGTPYSFFASGERSCLPHYVPEWLKRAENDGRTLTALPVVFKDFANQHQDAVAVFTRDYSHSYSGALSCAAFELILRCYLRELEGRSSEQILLSFLRVIEREAEINEEEARRLDSLRNKSNRLETFVYTSIAAMAADALLVCLVAKVACELAFSGSSVAISGTYWKVTDGLFHKLFSLHKMRWAEFFFGTIINVRGEGTLAELLGESGALNGRSWCQGILGYLRICKKNELAEAERELATMEMEEERKSREIRFCPHCGTEFIVAERNCGTFYCGRDAHRVNGSHAVGGVAVRGGYGCGQKFDVDKSRPYKRNEANLALLRQKRDEQRCALFRYGGLRHSKPNEATRRQNQDEDATSFWESVSTFAIPVLDVRFDWAGKEDSILPVFSAVLTKSTMESKGTALVKLLYDCERFNSQCRLLPDLVKLYEWLHFDLAHLITRDQALSMAMDDLMTEGRLLRRFDIIVVEEMMRTWERLTVGVGRLLKEQDYKIAFDCQETRTPFRSLEEALLLTLVSEGDHATDGNDFLFLLIRQIIGQYNSLIGRLEEFTANHPKKYFAGSVNPASLATGSSGALGVGRLSSISASQLDLIVEKSWDPKRRTFQLDYLEAMLFRHVLLLRYPPPMITDPMTHLRRRFRFRGDASTSNGVSTTQDDGGGKRKMTKRVVSQSRFGFHFGNEQDRALYDDVRQLMEDLDDNGDDTDAAYRGIIGDAFHNFDYIQHRSMLEGIRGVLQVLQTQGIDQGDTFSKTVTTIMGISRYDGGIDTFLHKLNFPVLGKKQKELLLSMTPSQLVGMVNFVGYQLSSEGYLFASLPLIMKCPMQPSVCVVIDLALTEMISTGSHKVTLDRLDEFVRDVLVLYESQIQRAATKSPNRSLVHYLRDDNPFCDESDAIFAIMPPHDVQLRHYVSLRCELHRIRLTLTYALEVDGTATNGDAGPKDEASTTTSRPYAWLDTEMY